MTARPPGVEVAIRSGIHRPEMVGPALKLYDRLAYEQSHVGEPVEFAGAVGLDIGGYDGSYRPVIGALGLRRVVTIEPKGEVVQESINSGMIPAQDAFPGTLQQWLAAGSAPADSAFAFNVMPSLPSDPTFIRAMATAVKVGGILATTFREPITAHQFSAAFRRDTSMQMRMLYDPAVVRSHPPSKDVARNQFLYLWRRER